MATIVWLVDDEAAKSGGRIPYKKVKGNKGLPDDIALLCQVWNERKGQLSPPVSPENSENEESDYESVGNLVSFG